MKHLLSVLFICLFAATAQAQMDDGIIEVSSSISGFEKAAVGYRWSDSDITGYSTTGYHRVKNRFDALFFGIGGDARKNIRIPFTQLRVTPILGSTAYILAADFGKEASSLAYTIESYGGFQLGRFDILSGVNWNLRKGDWYWQPVSVRMRF